MRTRLAIATLLAAGALLTGCTEPDSAGQPAATPGTIDVSLPVTPDSTAPTPTAPALPVIRDQVSAPAGPTASAPAPVRPRSESRTVAPPAPKQVTVDAVPPAPLAPAPAPEDHPGFREDPESYEPPAGDVVQEQLPEEVIGSYRCGDDTLVVVAIDESGDYVCGPS